MSLKVIVPKGQTEITVNGLHQWDFGRTIEIHADGLPSMVEVHFACAGMNEAVVRSCAMIDGAVTAAVPDTCLEQSTPIVAWVYDAGETSGATILTITLPIIPRTRPQPSETIPESVSDKYTEAVAAMNALVEASEQTGAENVETLRGIIAAFNGNLSAAPQLNEAKQLTEGAGFYYVMLFEEGSDIYCSGMVYWIQGIRSILPTVMTYNLEAFGVYRLDVWVDSDGHLHVYQRNTTPSGEETRADVTNAWNFYTKKFAG